MTFRIDAPIFDDDGDWDDDRYDDYVDGLMEQFASSPEAAPVIERYGGVHWTANMVYYGTSYIGETPATMSAGDLREIVFELFPRKISCDPQDAEETIAELRAFWQFAGREYSLPQAAACLDVLADGAVEQLRDELSNSSNFGMAKSFVMMGREAGYNMSTEEGLQQFMQTYNASMLAGRKAADEVSRESDFDHPSHAPPPPPGPRRPPLTSGSGPLRQRKKKLAKAKRAAKKVQAKKRRRKGK